MYNCLNKQQYLSGKCILWCQSLILRRSSYTLQESNHRPPSEYCLQMYMQCDVILGSTDGALVRALTSLQCGLGLVCDYFIRNNCIHSHNTRNRNDLHLPAPKLSLGKNTFRYSGSILFNKLPRTLKGATLLYNFKNLLKQYFIR